MNEFLNSIYWIIIPMTFIFFRGVETTQKSLVLKGWKQMNMRRPSDFVNSLDISRCCMGVKVVELARTGSCDQVWKRPGEINHDFSDKGWDDQRQKPSNRLTSLISHLNFHSMQCFIEQMFFFVPSREIRTRGLCVSRSWWAMLCRMSFQTC